MSKRNNPKRRDRNKNKKEVEVETTLESKKVIKMLIVMAITFGLFYLITIGILSKKESAVKKYDPTIQYKKILVGESFTKKKGEYLVLYYNSKVDNMDDIHTMLETYNEKKDKIYLYTVDMSEALNKKYISDESNREVTKAEDLKIAGTTLIHFKDKKVVEYITDGIDTYLK